MLDYPLTPFIWDGVRRALLSMAEIQFAAGARSVYPVHEMARHYTSWAQARQAIDGLPYQAAAGARGVGPCDGRLRHVGRCAPGRDAMRKGATMAWRNLSVHDGSLFPTSIGANPQLSIYALAARLASGLAQELTGKPAPGFGADMGRRA